MSLLDELRTKEAVLRNVGQKIRSDAQEAAASFSYIDSAEPNVIVIETNGEVVRKPLSAAERRARK